MTAIQLSKVTDAKVLARIHTLAIHEAGHALAAFLLRGCASKIEIISTARHGFAVGARTHILTADETPTEQVITAMAGYVAESIALGVSARSRYAMRRSNAKYDKPEIRDGITELRRLGEKRTRDQLHRKLERETAALLRTNWPKVVALARVLETRGTLSKAKVGAILNGNRS